MRTLMVLALSTSIAGLPGTAVASDKVFTGVFQGTGRACSGALYVRAKTIEWNSTYSICNSTQYEVLEKNSDSSRERIVFRLKKPGRQCRYSIVEIEHASAYNWNVSGYQSLEGFQKRDLLDWSNSPLPERKILSCPMTGPD
jgi:hypothetical protein